MVQVPLREGDVVGDVYRVERIIGVGGMAVVALASTAERRRLAIKMMLPDVVGHEQVVKRFWREVRTLSQLHSEHTLRIYGSGNHGRLPFMLLEYLQGSDLGAVLKSQGPMPIDAAVECILQVCHSLAEAHSLGITHRDIKPGNLFLTRRHDGSTCLKVLDFGISKVESAGPTDEPSLTKTTAVMGSPFYMSPEQMISSRDVDARTDIWALAVTLYELLTKSLPFAAETPEAVCFRILHGEPTPLRKIRPMYPKGLDEAISRSLQRNPGRRFANIADFATALADFGPPHSKHALSSIYDLVEPSAPRTIPVHELEAAGALSEAGGGQATTVYLQKQKPRGGGGLAIGVGLVTFIAGAGLGWVMSLNTDPTSKASAAPLPPAPASVSAAPKVALAPAPSASAAPIDLDQPEPSAAATRPAPAPSRVGMWPGPPRSAPLPPPPAPASVPPAPPRPAPSTPSKVEF